MKLLTHTKLDLPIKKTQSKSRHLWHPLTILTLAVALVSCGGASNSDLDDGTTNSQNNLGNSNSLSETGTPRAALQLQESQTDQAFEDYLKQSLENMNQLTAHREFIATDMLLGAPEVAMEMADSAASAAPATIESSGSVDDTVGTDSNFSTTYLQEQGVDESDLVKFDGEFLYIANQPQYYFWAEPIPLPTVELATVEITDDVAIEASAVASRLSIAPYPQPTSEKPTIRVMRISEDPAMAEEIGNLELVRANDQVSDDRYQNMNINGLYLSDDQLTVLSAQSHYGIWDHYQYWTSGSVGINTYDTTDPNNVAATDNAIIEGAYLIGSRRIGDSLFLVTRSTPTLPKFHWYPTTEEQIATNQEVIETLKATDLLPTIHFADGSSEPLVYPNRCFLPYQSDQSGESGGNDSSGEDSDWIAERPSYYMPEIISIVRINLRDITDREAHCTTAPTHGIYMSKSALYLHGTAPYTYYQQASTTLHKFKLSEGEIQYRGSGVIPGYLGGSNPAYRLGETDGALVAVTNNVAINSDIPEDNGHRLTILQENDSLSALVVAAQIPNATDPAPIGKLNESIHGVRIMGDRAYVVTFERWDPLYVIDLKEIDNPTIAGELEIPGFSDLLHPINDSLLLGIGYSADESNGRPQGVKASLFNVDNIDEPYEMESIVLGGSGTHSPAAHSPKAFSFLSYSEDEFRFSLPIRLVEENATPDNPQFTSHQWQYTGLALFSITGLSDGKATMTDNGAIKRAEASSESEFTSPYYHQGWLDSLERGILLGDSAHYLSGSQLWSAPWGSPDQAVGPQ